MLTNDDDNFDDIDLDELFNDFDEKQSSIIPRQTKYDFSQYITKTNHDDLMELNESDCTAPRIIRKRTKIKKKISEKQMTMYDYASSISYKHKQFYSSLDNSITTKTIIKGQKRSLIECQQSSPMAKKSKTNDYDQSFSSATLSPDFIDNLLRYLDERSHNTSAHEIQEHEPLPKNDMKKKKTKSSIL